jgi:hypothetical protein
MLLRVEVDATCACKRRYVDRCRSCLDERLCGSSSGSAGGKDVVDKQNMLSMNSGGIRNLESAADILPALTQRKSCLAFGGTKSHKSAGRQREFPGRMRLLQRENGELCESTGLVESSLFVFSAMKGYRDHEKFRGSLWRQLSNGLTKQRTEPPGSGVYAIVFERMNSGPHTAFIGAECHGSGEGWWGEPAGGANVR